MYCTNCGTKVEDGAKSCPHCGVSTALQETNQKPAEKSRKGACTKVFN